MKALVTGGGGFLGKAIVKKLLGRDWQVRVLNRRAYSDLEEMGAEIVLGNVADSGPVGEAVSGCDVVFHTAAKVAMWGPYDEFYTTNVEGTKNIIDACLKHGVPKLVYTSTPSVIHGGGDVAGIDESAPYPENFKAAYPKTKAMAEQSVLRAHGKELATIALRPHLIWGPGNDKLVAGIVERRRLGKLRLIGKGEKLIDSIYIDNAADAHLCACNHLSADAVCGGKPYFISQGEPWPMDRLINGILRSAGLPPVDKTISPKAAYLAGMLFEAAYTLLKKDEEPLMTRFIANQLSTAHWYDVSAARRDLGFTPAISITEGLKRLEDWFKGLDKTE